MANKNGKDFEEFNERFETVEQALKYIADSQAESEWLRKKSEAERRQSEVERRKFETESKQRSEQFEIESKQRWKQIEKHLAHITKLTGIAFEELEFNDEKLEEAGKILSRKRK